MVKVFGVKLTASFIATIIYTIASFILFLIVCFYGWKRVLEQEQKNEEIAFAKAKKAKTQKDSIKRTHTQYMKVDDDANAGAITASDTITHNHAQEIVIAEKTCNCKRVLQWMKLVWKMKSIYLSALVHIYDIATDVGIIVDWGIQAFREKNGGPKQDVRSLNMMGLFISSLVAFFLYRFISAGFVYEFTGKFSRACIQFFDLEIYHAIYITHKLGRDEAGNLQRWLQKFEAIFESAAQALLQLVYIVKTADYSELIISSIILSFFSVAARFTADDKIFFNADAEALGLKWNRRKCKKGEARLLKTQQNAFEFEKQSTVDRSLAPNEVKVGSIDSEEDFQKDIDSEKLRKSEDEWETLFPRWKLWSYIGFNRAYLFRYSFRMCDVFSRLMILSLIWCTLSGTVALCILAFEMVTFVIYATSMGKYNFFQFLVATYFSEENPNQTVSYCFFRRMESLLYLIGVSVVVLFHDKYNKDSVLQCYKEYGTVQQCITETEYDREICDCNLETEVLATKMLLIAAWAFGNLSGAVFFGAFHSMREKFGTNERNIVNVMEKRDWEAFSEMLQFGYRMNRFDNKSQRSALSTFLDRVPSDKFDAEEIDKMIQLGADINDTSKVPQDEQDQLEPDKIGDNVLIRYIKVTKCNIIDEEFENVVKKWTTDGISGGDYSQDIKRITVDINAQNKDGYTAFKVYWEKMQYERREKHRIREKIAYKIKCYKIENEISDEQKVNVLDLINRNELNDRNEQWFANFYRNILKWKRLGADMSTLSEDRISALLAYVQDTDSKDIDMETVQLLCPTNSEHESDSTEQKYDNDTIKIGINNSDNDRQVTQQIKMKAFETWIHKYNSKQVLFAVKDLQIWHNLGCTQHVKDMNLLSLYLQRCPVQEQATNDIDILLECGCSLENDDMKTFISLKPLPMRTVIDNAFDLKTKVERYDDALGRWYKLKKQTYYNDEGLGKFMQWCKNRWARAGNINSAIAQAEQYFNGKDTSMHPNRYFWEYAQDGYEITNSTKKFEKVLEECWRNDLAFGGEPPVPINLKMLAHLQDKYGLDSEVSLPNVYDIDTYHTRLQNIIETQGSLSVSDVKQLLKMGYLLAYEGADIQQILYKATLNKKLSFEVFDFLLTEVVNHRESESEEKKEESEIIELDYQIFNQWIAKNENIKFEQIEKMINTYHFSPYKCDANNKCSIHFIWENIDIPLEVMHQYWAAYGVEKFGKFLKLYQGFLYHILERKNLTEIKQIKFLEDKFSEYMEKSEQKSGNNIIHYYCKNQHINMTILKYICEKYKVLLNQTNEKDHHALHLLCQNGSVNIEFLQYFVEELKVPQGMEIKTHAGWQPYKAIHYLVDNEEVIWTLNDVKIMIHNLDMDFANNRRSGEYILYRLSHQNNFTTEALIYLYDYYKDKVKSGLNSFKSKKTMYYSKSSGGTGIFANLLKRKLPITPKQIAKLIQIGFDITAKDSEHSSILHYASNGNLTASTLRLIGKEMKRKLGKKFTTIDMLDRSGATPFQLWVAAVDTEIGKYMDIVEVWEALGADITQSENNGAYNMLHNLLCGDIWNVQLAFLRKMCFDDENQWIAQEKKTGNVLDDLKGKAKKPVSQYQIPLHAKPIPDNMTLSRLYALNAVQQAQDINVNVLKYFKTKAPVIRFDLDTQNSVLWNYMQNKVIHLSVLKYLIEELKFKIQPQPNDNIALRYMTYHYKRDKIDFDILDYFYKVLKVDFKQKQNEYVTILHEYAKNTKYFDCNEFVELIERYDLHSILIEKGSTDPTAAGSFYETRRAEIRPDIIKCFKKLGYVTNEAVGNLTPIQHYCELTPNHYINPIIVQSFIDDAGAKINHFIGRKKETSVTQIIANSDTKIAYDKLQTLQLIMDNFGVKIETPNKRKQDIWYMFIQRFHNGHFLYDTFLKQFLRLIRIYIRANTEPIHLFHSNEVDGHKKIKYKIYTVKDVDYESELKLKKNLKKLKEAKKYINRIMFVVDDRDSVFRSCKPIDPRSAFDWDQKRIPQKWLIPIVWSEFITQINELEMRYHNFTKSHKLAECNMFIDMKLINQITSLHSNKEMINDIQLQGSQNLLLKYLRCNHQSALFAKDIDSMKQLGIDFRTGYINSNDALRNYCSYVRNEGILDKSILEALIRGGCPINWDFEENQEDDSKKGEVIKTSYTPLQYYAMSEESNIDSFKKLIEVGADLTIESAHNFTAVYYLLKCSKCVTPEFITYLAKDCKYNFNTALSTATVDEREADTILFNFYLRENKNITVETVRALINIADCDANSRDDSNDTNSLKSYIKNANVEKFSMEIIETLVRLGADINEPDNEGVYPVQHLLQLNYTPLSTVMEYIRQMLQFGAKLEHILCDDETVIQDHKLYILKDMKDGYEDYNDSWCVIDAWIYEYNNKKNKIQSAVALDESGANTTLYINIRRSNLIDITKKYLLHRDNYPQLRNVQNIMSIERNEMANDDIFSEDENDGFDDHKEEEREEKEMESDNNIVGTGAIESNEKELIAEDHTALEMAKLVKT